MALLLERVYGAVEIGVSLGLPAFIEGFARQKHHRSLTTIYDSLCQARGFKQFVSRKKLPGVDFFIPDARQIVEFDEPQHFTLLRAISLELYPSRLRLGYDKEAWRKRSVEFDRHDNSPVYRDEQRAWYDTLRDFAPAILGYPPIIRVFAGDAVWCEMNPCSRKDIKRFKSILGIQD